MLDPDQFCAVCGEPYGVADEHCPACGFDPVGNTDDAVINDEALRRYEEKRNR